MTLQLFVICRDSVASELCVNLLDSLRASASVQLESFEL
jgi:hypothetical protein